MELEAGTTFAEWVNESVDPEAMKALAVLLADPNPIHLDPEAVRAVGLGDRTINQGPANCGYVMNMLGAALPAAELESLQVRFLENVRARDRVVAGGEIESVQVTPEGRRVHCRVWLDIDGGARALEGTATLAIGPTS
jgi:acyl dehydratase